MIATKQLARVGVSVGRIESAKVWNRLGLGFALALSAALNLWNLAQNGYGNTYYAVAVQSMMQSWTNFFFGSYDAGGFITVDKPPVALMMQAISAKIFGFSGLAILVPEALAGVASVGILYYLVRKVWGPLAGFLAAVALAITPIAVAIERSNNTDTWLVFFLLLAAWALSVATEKGKLGALLGALALVGVAFNVKMLAAWVVLPGFYLLYFVGAPVSWAKRIVHLAMATVVVLAVSLSWAVVTDYVVPADARPWIGGSQNNSVLELALGYNGFGRVTGEGERFGGGGGGGRGGFNGGGQPPADGGRGGFQGGQPGGNFGGGGPGGAGGSFGTGEPGALRLFNSALIDQWSWLIPLALLGLPVALLGARRGTLKDTLTNPKLHSLLLWGGWLACYGVVYSMAAGIFHTYYVVMLAPPAAALVGAGVSSMWLAYRRGGWQGWILPIALLATAVYQIAILSAYPQWAAWLAPLLIGGTLLAAGGLVAARLMQLQRGSWRRLAPALVAVGLVAAAVSPFAWATTPVSAAGNATLPEAGPSGSDAFGGGRGGFGGGNFGGGTNSALVSYLEANRDGYFYLLAVSSANEASSIALSTGEPVLAMGGFSGSDPAMTVEKMQAMVANKQLRFVMGASGSVSSWLQSNCSAVDTSQFGGTGGFGGFGGGRGGNSTLYDCAAQ